MNIKTENLSFKYKGSKKEVYRNLNLEIGENCICGLLGKNGVGKSTLLYLIAGMLKPTEGSVTVNGMVSRDRKPEMLQDMFFVSEEYDLPHVSLSDYVAVNSRFYPNFSNEILQQCLEDFELPSDLNLGELSMGQKKKVFMSFALATGTSLLLMDEPTNGLDIPSKVQFRKAVSRVMDQDRIVIISTHQVHDVEQLLDRVVIMGNEGILLNKTCEEICEDYVFEVRMPNEVADDVVYAESSLMGNLVMAKRGDKPESALNLELLFNAVTQKIVAP